VVAGSAAAVGAPIMADTTNAAPAAAKNEVVRDFVARIARPFSIVSTDKVPASELF
jgi:hypothetical protein